MFAAITALGTAANSVFGNKATGELGLGRDITLLARDYATATATAVAALATGAVALPGSISSERYVPLAVLFPRSSNAHRGTYKCRETVRVKLPNV